MVSAQFADSTIVRAIQANETNFDFSVTALVVLKNSGVSQSVIEEMLSVGAVKKDTAAVAAATPEPEPSPPPFSGPPPKKIPGIRAGSRIYLENKGASDESQMFADLFREKLSRDDSSRNYMKPGFPIADKKVDAAYVLRFLPVMRENEKSFLENAQEHARVNVWLLDSSGNLLWEHNYDCVRVFREPARECYQHISDDLKAAQVNSDDKRAGLLGWRRH
jgi:hypothetical protein